MNEIISAREFGILIFFAAWIKLDCRFYTFFAHQTLTDALDNICPMMNEKIWVKSVLFGLTLDSKFTRWFWYSMINVKYKECQCIFLNNWGLDKGMNDWVWPKKAGEVCVILYKKNFRGVLYCFTLGTWFLSSSYYVSSLCLVSDY